MAHDVYGYFQTFHLENELERSAAFALMALPFKDSMSRYDG